MTDLDPCEIWISVKAPTCSFIHRLPGRDSFLFLTFFLHPPPNLDHFQFPKYAKFMPCCFSYIFCMLFFTYCYFGPEYLFLHMINLLPYQFSLNACYCIDRILLKGRPGEFISVITHSKCLLLTHLILKI